MTQMRTPPRFVPTLTTVVELPAEESPAQAPAIHPPSPVNHTTEEILDSLEHLLLPALNFAEPPSEPTSTAQPLAAGSLTSSEASPTQEVASTAVDAKPFPEQELFWFEEQLLHRVLLLVDLSLEERLHSALSSFVARQVESMIPSLQKEIEKTVRTVIAEALTVEKEPSPSFTGSMPVNPNH